VQVVGVLDQFIKECRQPPAASWLSGILETSNSREFQLVVTYRNNGLAVVVEHKVYSLKVLKPPPPNDGGNGAAAKRL
jgi:hypothetical protein